MNRIKWVFDDGYGLRFGWWVVVFLLGAAACIFGFCCGVNAVEAASCSRQATAMGRAHRYSFLTDCMVKTDDGHYVPLDNYRLTQQESGK